MRVPTLYMRVPTFYSWRGEVTAYVRRIRLNVANRSTCDCITLNTGGNALGIKSKVRVFSKVCHSEYRKECIDDLLTQNVSPHHMPTYSLNTNGSIVPFYAITMNNQFINHLLCTHHTYSLSPAANCPLQPLTGLCRVGLLLQLCVKTNTFNLTLLLPSIVLVDCGHPKT